MRKLILLLTTMFSFALCAPKLLGQDTPLATPPAEDVKQIRKLIADLEAERKLRADAEEREKYWRSSADSWKGLFEKEKARADGVQEKRVDETGKALDEEKRANFFLRQQTEADRQKIGELTFDNRKLKSERKWWFGAGVVTGGAAGGWVGNQVCKKGLF